MCHQDVAANGWTSMPANAGAIFADRPFINKPDDLLLSDIKFPSDDPVVSKTLKYAKEVLHPETFNHSMRVFFYGMSVCLSKLYQHRASRLTSFRDGNHQTAIPGETCHP